MSNSTKEKRTYRFRLIIKSSLPPLIKPPFLGHDSNMLHNNKPPNMCPLLSNNVSILSLQTNSGSEIPVFQDSLADRQLLRSTAQLRLGSPGSNWRIVWHTESRISTRKREVSLPIRLLPTDFLAMSEARLIGLAINTFSLCGSALSTYYS